MEYVPRAGRQDLFPEARINLCDFPCQPESIQARITLASSHLGRNCDRDTYTVQVFSQICHNLGQILAGFYFRNGQMERAVYAFMDLLKVAFKD